jgi:general secretion pathway protein F
MLLQSGINLLRALELTRDASSNIVVSRGLETARDEVTRGLGLEGSLRRTRILPPDVVDMVVTAQETGALAENLIYAADIYEEELNNKMRIISTMTEPLMVIVVGSVVVFVALSLFLPYIKLLSLMSGGAGE